MKDSVRDLLKGGTIATNMAKHNETVDYTTPVGMC